MLDESRHKAEVCGHDPPTMLRAHLVGLYTSGLMTAKALTTLCWFITMAGGAGVEDLAQSPATVGFNASRTCIRALGLDLIQSTCLMDVEIPIYNRTSCKTSLGHITVLPFFEAMSIEFKRKQHLFMKHVQAAPCGSRAMHRCHSLVAHHAAPAALLRKGNAMRRRKTSSAP